MVLESSNLTAVPLIKYDYHMLLEESQSIFRKICTLMYRWSPEVPICDGAYAPVSIDLWYGPV